jgi:hypothetical protein
VHDLIDKKIVQMNDLNKQMRKESIYFDEKTGEILSTVYSTLSISKRIKLNGRFFKIFKRFISDVSHIHQPKLLTLLNLMDKDQKLHSGIFDNDMNEKKLKNNSISKLLGCNASTVYHFLKHMKDIRAIKKIGKDFYVNPTFASIASKCPKKLLIPFIEFDPNIRQYMSKKDKEAYDVLSVNSTNK